MSLICPHFCGNRLQAPGICHRWSTLRIIQRLFFNSFDCNALVAIGGGCLTLLLPRVGDRMATSGIQGNLVIQKNNSVGATQIRGPMGDDEAYYWT